MTPPRERRTSSRALTRADLPAEFTPETVRRLSFRVLKELDAQKNELLTDAERQQFDSARGVVFREIFDRAEDADARSRRGGPRGLDPEMRRSYQRAQQRLQEQARRARQALPEPEDEPTPVNASDESESHDEEVSADSLTEDIEESSTILELLDRIAGVEEQQLEHQKSQLLLDTRGFFFAFLVSVSVIVAGVAPLVEAEPHDRFLIVAWTLLACGLAGLVYGAVRLAQREK